MPLASEGNRGLLECFEQDRASSLYRNDHDEKQDGNRGRTCADEKESIESLSADPIHHGVEDMSRESRG